MKKIMALLMAAAFTLTVGAAFAQDASKAPTAQKEEKVSHKTKHAKKHGKKKAAQKADAEVSTAPVAK